MHFLHSRWLAGLCSRTVRAFPCYVRFPKCIEVTNYCFGRSFDCSPFSIQLCWMWWVSFELREDCYLLSNGILCDHTQLINFWRQRAHYSQKLPNVRLESRSMQWCTFHVLAACGSPFTPYGVALWLDPVGLLDGHRRICWSLHRGSRGGSW